MINRKTSFVSGLLLLSATAGLAQSADQPITIPQGTSIRLQANSVNAASYQWFRNGDVIDQATQSSYTVFLAGKYTVVSYNAEGCSSDISPPVIINIGPGTPRSADVMVTKHSEIRAVALKDAFEYTIQVKNNGIDAATMVKVQDILPEQLTFQELSNPSLGLAHYNTSSRTVFWEMPKLDNGQTADLKIKVIATQPGVIRNTASVIANETDPNPKNNQSLDSKSITGIIIPNVFTPNGDGRNDTFEIPGLEYYDANEITILNRWGSTVYYRKGYKNDWTGGDLNEGTYFYLLKVKSASDKWEVYKGYITIIRALKK